MLFCVSIVVLNWFMCTELYVCVYATWTDVLNYLCLLNWMAYACLFSTEWRMCVCAELDGVCVFVFNWMGSSVKFYGAHWLHIQKDWIQETKTLDNNIRLWPFIWYMVLSSYIEQSSYMVLSIMLCIKLIHNPTTPHSLTWSIDHTEHHYN
jgi:hypothetical protein